MEKKNSGHIQTWKSPLQKLREESGQNGSLSRAVASTYTFSLGILDRIFSRRQFGIFFFIFPENRFGRLMQIVFIRDNLHEMLNPVF